MDALAQQLIALALPLLAKGGEQFATKAGEAAFQQAKAVWRRITRCFQRDAAAAQALAELEEEPESNARQTTARDALVQALDSDRALQADVEPLAQELRKVCETYTAMTVNISGGRVENMTQVGSVGGDFIIGKR